MSLNNLPLTNWPGKPRLNTLNTFQYDLRRLLVPFKKHNPGSGLLVGGNNLNSLKGEVSCEFDVISKPKMFCS